MAREYIYTKYTKNARIEGVSVNKAASERNFMERLKVNEAKRSFCNQQNKLKKEIEKMINDEIYNPKEIIEILKEKYPDKEVSTMNKYQIILKTSEDGTDLSKANKYTLENEDGYISVFKYNKEGKKELVEKTSIQIKSLPKSVQEELKDAIVLDNEDDAYSRLEDFGS